ncbi:unnamed protein product [Fusarium graminearum]|nr:unnamed protein product [Fusarium graminearum]
MRPSELAKLTADELAVSTKPILTELLQRSSQGYSAETTETYNLLASRAAEPAVMTAITPGRR